MPRLAATDPQDAASEDRQRWARLAELIATADRDGMSALRPDELDEFARLYRRTTSDLAAARTRRRDPRLVAYLNGLAGRAAGLIYGAPARRRIDPLRFFLVTIPRTFRATAVYTAVAFALFLAPAIASYLMTSANPAWAAALFDARLEAMVEDFLARDVPPGQYFADTTSLIGADNLSGFVLANNLKVALVAFALGITAGIGTAYALVGNGLMLGSFVGVFAHYDRLIDPIAIVAPHGFLELSAIFMAGGAGLMIGWAIIDPGDRLRLEAMADAARRGVVLLAAALITLGFAAIFEGFVSPQASGLMHTAGPRILVGFTAWVAMCAWLLLGDRLVRTPDAPWKAGRLEVTAPPGA